MCPHIRKYPLTRMGSLTRMCPLTRIGFILVPSDKGDLVGRIEAQTAQYGLSVKGSSKV